MRGIARTTKAVEGWHFGIQLYFSGAHPSMWKVVDSLQKDASMQKRIFFMHRVAINLQKKYRVLNVRVQNIMSADKNKIDLYFFRALSSFCYIRVNLSFSFYSFVSLKFNFKFYLMFCSAFLKNRFLADFRKT